jgi:predicted Zn finger-like uncharacterized protein
MTMFTRCSHCGATFRVTLDQLQSSSGQVRCGVCEQVFDAFVALSANDPRAGGPRIAVEHVELSRVPVEAQPVETIEAGPVERYEAQSRALDLDLSDGETAPPPGEPVATADLPPPAPDPDAGRPFPHEPFALPRPVARTSPMLIALALLLVAALGLQGAYFFRSDIAAFWPGSRPLLEAACARLRCAVPLPRLADRLTIETSDLQALDPSRPNRVVLTATIRNRAGLDQAWPMLELTLTNARDQMSARKVFTPAEYLEGGASARGIAANAEAGIRLRLDTGDIVAAGYRIYLFHL